MFFSPAKEYPNLLIVFIYIKLKCLLRKKHPLSQCGIYLYDIIIIVYHIVSGTGDTNQESSESTQSEDGTDKDTTKGNHYENLPMQYTVLSKVVKNENFRYFLIFAQSIDCGYTLEPPRRGGSNVYPQSMFWSKNKKNRYTPAYPSCTI